MYSLDLLTSEINFGTDNYGDAPLSFIKSLGIDGEEYHKEGKLEILRASCMTPWCYDDETFDYWAPRIKEALQKKFELIAEHENIL